MTGTSPHDPRSRGFRSRSTVEEVHALIDARVAFLTATDDVPLSEAFGRVLANAVAAEHNVPPFDRAAMDGFALRGEETFGADGYAPAAFRIVGRSRPGQPYASRVGPGEAVAIATGAPLPDGADAVAKFESTRRIGDTIEVVEPTAPRRHVGFAGEDIASGRTVFEANRVLRPQDLGLLSALGFATIPVVRQPRVAILLTGDELLPAGSRPERYRIADMNGPMLTSLVGRDGGIARLIGPIADDPDTILRLLKEAVGSSDFVIVSGGSSTGPEDHSPSILRDLGELPIHGVAVRPSSPTGLGFVGAEPVLLAPGNPVSCLCAYDLFGGRIVRRLGGRQAGWEYWSRDAPLAEKLVSALGRVDYARVRIVGGEVVAIATSGASILSSTTEADGFVLVPASVEGFAAGEMVRVWLY